MSIVFDAFKYQRTLLDGGIEPKLATALTNALVEAFTENVVVINLEPARQLQERATAREGSKS